MQALVEPQVRQDEVRKIAQEAYVYGFPIVESYRLLHSYFVDSAAPDYKGRWNEIHHVTRVVTPDDKAMQTPNPDTPYSYLGLDLRTEPMVLTVPAIEAGRYHSVECVDLYTHIFGYIGTRTTGNEAGHFMIAGPGWRGEDPEGTQATLICETEFAFMFFRTQLFRPGDLENVRQVQAGYRVQPLSSFAGTAAPAAAPKVGFLKPISAERERNSLDFFKQLNFVLQFCPTHPSETALMERFGRIEVGADKTFDAREFSPELLAAIEGGRADAWKAYAETEKRMAAGELTSADVLGSRPYLKNNYLYRMVGTVDGIWGNAKEEAVYPGYLSDAEGLRLDAATNRYSLRFPPGQLPPVNAFWSLAMYGLPSRLLVTNRLKRYVINSAMLPGLKRDADGGLTIYIQHASPGRDKESNWLPAPSGPFLMGLRMYWPKPEAYEGRWKKPPLQRVH
jgi:hypothetical protein